ncbi:MAG: dihydroneopterin aldolase [Gammaproteobacteria bacterium]|nr:dihydroneopterin aldolase [Gammaproteobacteria bacterium]
MDTIYLSDLKIDTVIGIFEWERRVKQTVSIDLEMSTDVARAARTDSIDDALDYKAVAKAVIEFVENSSFQLVETLAERVAELIIRQFGVVQVRLRVNKRGAIRGARDVGVMIERTRSA